MDAVLGLLIIIITLVIIYLLIKVPIYIAKTRELDPKDIKTITILSWCGLLIGLTWFVALIWALVGDRVVQIEKKNEHVNEPLDNLKKLGDLRDQGVITDEEFNEQKRDLLIKLKEQ